MALNKVGTVAPTPANSVDLCSAVLRAGNRLGLQHKELADIFGLSAPDFSAAFSPNRLDRNRTMKSPLPLALAREVALVLCEQVGLAVGGPDVERHALADVLRACSDYVRILSR
jgi:hypothetical protein